MSDKQSSSSSTTVCVEDKVYVFVGQLSKVTRERWNTLMAHHYGTYKAFVVSIHRKIAPELDRHT